VTRSLGEHARGAEHGEAEAVMCSIEMEKEHNSSLGGGKLHRSAMVAVAMAASIS
jgi:hypothetical protein